MAVLGPFSGSDVVEVIYRKSDGGSGSIRADYRRPRDAFYNVRTHAHMADEQHLRHITVLQYVHSKHGGHWAQLLWCARDQGIRNIAR